MNSQRITNLNVKCEAVELPGDIGGISRGHGLDDNFLDVTPKPKSMKEKHQ